jgi:hypothetical protein
VSTWQFNFHFSIKCVVSLPAPFFFSLREDRPPLPPTPLRLVGELRGGGGGGGPGGRFKVGRLVFFFY